METKEFLNLGVMVAEKLNWSTATMYMYCKCWWEIKPIPLRLTINYN